MAPTVEPSTRSQIHQIVLELRGDWPWHRASLIKGNGDDILFAFDDGLGHGAFRSEVPGLAIGDESVAVAHEEEGPKVVDAVESGDLGGSVPFEQYHNKIVIDIEPALDRWGF